MLTPEMCNGVLECPRVKVGIRLNFVLFSPTQCQCDQNVCHEMLSGPGGSLGTLNQANSGSWSCQEILCRYLQ